MWVDNNITWSNFAYPWNSLTIGKKTSQSNAIVENMRKISVSSDF
jgi:hypothetical protein